MGTNVSSGLGSDRYDGTGGATLSHQRDFAESFASGADRAHAERMRTRGTTVPIVAGGRLVVVSRRDVLRSPPGVKRRR
jgi:hypothetical protein